MDLYAVNPFIRFVESVFYQKSTEEFYYHKDCRILYVQSGTADLFIDSKHYELRPGFLFYCPAQVVYRILSSGIALIALNFDLTQEDNSHTTPYPPIPVQELPAPTEAETDSSSDAFMNHYLHIVNGEDFFPYIQQILEEFSTQKVYYRESGSAILKHFLISLYRYSISSTTDSVNAISNILEYIRTNYAKPLDNEQLAVMSGYHKNHLNRLFIKHTGTSIHQYILNTRITEAKKLLLSTSLSVSIIAESVGFNSNIHFSNYFKQEMGISPSEYRKRFQNII